MQIIILVWFKDLSAVASAIKEFRLEFRHNEYLFI